MGFATSKAVAVKREDPFTRVSPLQVQEAS